MEGKIIVIILAKFAHAPLHFEVQVERSCPSKVPIDALPCLKRHFFEDPLGFCSIWQKVPTQNANDQSSLVYQQRTPSSPSSPSSSLQRAR
jgi:hypothetical protein